MVFAAWIAFLGLVSWLFQGLLERQFNPNQSPESAMLSAGEIEVVLGQNRAGHYVTSGLVNGHRVRFLVDTGATDVALSQKAAKKLGLKSGAPLRLSTANGMVRGYRTIIESISIGNIRQRNIAAVISPGIDDGIILLGMSFLRNIELVQRSGTLILRQSGR